MYNFETHRTSSRAAWGHDSGNGMDKRRAENQIRYFPRCNYAALNLLYHGVNAVFSGRYSEAQCMQRITKGLAHWRQAPQVCASWRRGLHAEHASWTAKLNPATIFQRCVSRSELLTNSAELSGPSSRSQAASARPSANCKIEDPLRF